MTVDNTDLQLRLQKMDDRQRVDHDNIVKIDTKMDAVLTQLSEMKDGTNKRLVAVEASMEYFKKLEIEINPRLMKSDIDVLKGWRERFSFTWKLVVVVSSTIGSVVGFALALMAGLSNMFNS